MVAVPVLYKRNCAVEWKRSVGSDAGVNRLKRASRLAVLDHGLDNPVVDIGRLGFWCWIEFTGIVQSLIKVASLCQRSDDHALDDPAFYGT